MGVLEILALASTQTTYLATADAAREFLAQVAALAPDWSQAEEWAQWYTIDADGWQCWFENRPQVSPYGEWTALGGACDFGSGYQKELPLGFDWRLAIWQRPE